MLGEEPEKSILNCKLERDPPSEDVTTIRC